MIPEYGFFFKLFWGYVKKYFSRHIQDSSLKARHNRHDEWTTCIQAGVGFSRARGTIARTRRSAPGGTISFGQSIVCLACSSTNGVCVSYDRKAAQRGRPSLFISAAGDSDVAGAGCLRARTHALGNRPESSRALPRPGARQRRTRRTPLLRLSSLTPSFLLSFLTLRCAFLSLSPSRVPRCLDRAASRAARSSRC